MPYGRELEAALKAADLAGAVILEHYARFTAIADAPVSISTAADRASQETILRHLQTDFPGDAFCGEEDTPALAAALHTGDRIWVVDPIDGTRGFAMKNGEFSVMIALVHEGRVVVGVVGEAATGRRTYASGGGGCWSRDGGGEARAVSVTRVATLSESTLIQSHSKPGRGPTMPVQRLRPARVTETYSAGIKLAQVARGEADLYVCDYDRLHDWDLAAGHIL
ncbi:MAG TPA: inositol monophosphatase family protein, partial [Gemmataceae bacterium]|nr:inositol monophosphatase family protein [Gemmataceae bacterium]